MLTKFSFFIFSFSLSHSRFCSVVCPILSDALMVSDLVSGFYDFILSDGCFNGVFFFVFVLFNYWFCLFSLLCHCFQAQNVHHLRHIRKSYGLLFTSASLLSSFFSVLSFSTPPSLTTLNSFTFCLSFMSICSWFCFQFGLLKVVRSALKVCLSEFPSQQSLFLARQWQIAFYRLSPYSLQPSSFLEEKKRHIRHTIFNYENITGRIEWNTWDAIASGWYEKKFEKDKHTHRATSREKMRVSKHSPMTLTIVYSRHCRNWYKWGKNGHFFVDRVKLDFT